MASNGKLVETDDERQPLTKSEFNEDENIPYQDEPRPSLSSVSTTSLVLERLGDESRYVANLSRAYEHANGQSKKRVDSFDVEDPDLYRVKPVDKKWKRILWVITALAVAGWGFAIVALITRGSYKHASTKPHDPTATASRGSGKRVTLEQVQSGFWSPQRDTLSWIRGADGEDGKLLEYSVGANKNFLVVEDVTNMGKDKRAKGKQVLMKNGGFKVNGEMIVPAKAVPSPNLKKVLIMSDRKKNWRHSYTGRYWIFDVETQEAEPLDHGEPDGRIQLATWAPTSDMIVFTRGNNMYLRQLSEPYVSKITKDGGPQIFYGVPDWVYEEEVIYGNSVTWWSEDGKFIAFLRTNETEVPTYPVQYFMSRPSGERPPKGLESYPEVRDIKYPKAGAPNPVVNLQFYDVEKGQVFTIDRDDAFEDHNRLITEVVWAGKEGKVLVRETNRESDTLKVVLIDVNEREAQIIREVDVTGIDGGWFEVSQDTTYIPPDKSNNRSEGGYIDTIVHEGYDHLAYFTPMDNPKPILLTSGDWEVVKAPSAVDLKNNLIYFVATKDGPTQRHVYSVKLDGTRLKPMTDTSKEGYYDVLFSKAAGYALLTYNGPDIPWQKVISTPSNDESFEHETQNNKELAKKASQHELPILSYGTINVDGFELNYLERKPPHFNAKRKYPVLFYMYQGPGSQSVDKKFNIDFQAYVAANLGYIVVTVDGRGTGFMGRKTRCIIRGNIGHYESHDQIEAAKIWAQKKYVDADRMAIWGWSYGGFMTLKTLEQDAGRTFKYGMAVAPVTDWRFYDSIYTERYMHTPQHNPSGYDNSSITDVESLSKNVRFLMMHGVADDNVHMQSTLTLLDQLDLEEIENYDVHIFPDSDHSIFFHNAHTVVYDKLSNWLVNAFNGEWLKIQDPKPILPNRR